MKTKVKEKSDWEDSVWAKDFEKAADDLNIPKPKPKKPLLVRLKIEREDGYSSLYRSHFTTFDKNLLIIAIVGVVSFSLIFLGIRQWRWSDEIVWGTKINSYNITTPYRQVKTYGDLLDKFEIGDKIPCKVRQRVVNNKTLKPWIISRDNTYDRRYTSSNGPVRIHWDMVYNILLEENKL